MLASHPRWSWQGRFATVAGATAIGAVATHGGVGVLRAAGTIPRATLAIHRPCLASSGGTICRRTGLNQGVIRAQLGVAVVNRDLTSRRWSSWRRACQ